MYIYSYHSRILKIRTYIYYEIRSVAVISLLYLLLKSLSYVLSFIVRSIINNEKQYIFKIYLCLLEEIIKMIIYNLQNI